MHSLFELRCCSRAIGGWTIQKEGVVPDIKLDFSRVTYSNVLEIIAPIVPGGILAVGTLVLNPSLASKLLSNPYLGYRSRLVLAIFVSYVAGLLLNLLVSYASYFVGYMLGLTLGSKLFPNPPTPWTCLQWRKLARKFLGADLAPETDELYFKDLHQQKLKETEAIPDAGQRASQSQFVQEFFRPKIESDVAWYWWYQTFEKYFATPQSIAAPWRYFLSMLHTASWAVILLMALNHRHHWFAWVLSITGVFFGNVSSWFSGGVQSDPYAFEQMAMLLRAMKPFDELDRNREKEPVSR